jgi:hypothetical protein
MDWQEVMAPCFSGAGNESGRSSQDSRIILRISADECTHRGSPKEPIRSLGSAAPTSSLPTIGGPPGKYKTIGPQLRMRNNASHRRGSLQGLSI